MRALVETIVGRIVALYLGEHLLVSLMGRNASLDSSHGLSFSSNRRGAVTGGPQC